VQGSAGWGDAEERDSEVAIKRRTPRPGQRAGSTGVRSRSKSGPVPVKSEEPVDPAEAMEKELVEEADEQALEMEDVPGGRQDGGKRRTTSLKNRAGGRRSTGAGLDGGTSGSRSAPPPSSRIRGWPLALKYVVLISMLIILVSVLFGLVVASIFRTKLESEIKSYGRLQTLALRGLGDKIYRDFVDPNIGDSTTNKYQTHEEGRRMLEHLNRIADADPRIKLLVIFAANSPGANPNGMVLSTGNPDRWTPPPPGLQPEDDVLIWRGKCQDQGVFEEALFFRTPIVGSGDRLTATANLVLSVRTLEQEAASMRNKIMIFGLIFVGVGIGISLLLASLVTRPIEALVRDMDIVSRGDLNHATRPMTNDEIGLLAATFNRMTASLREAQEKEREVNRLNSELNLAKEIHAKLMPDKLPNLPGYDIFTAYYCAKEVGGDYYDFFGVDVEKGLLGMVVADVSGKGIPGSMVMGTTRTILRMMAAGNPSPADVLSKTNYHIARDIKRGMFVTMMYVILGVRTREMAIASAGHNPMVIWRQATRTHELVRPNGIALGFDKGPIFDRTVREQKVQLYKGDRVVLYTDGVVESMNEQREEWGDDTFYKFVCDHAELPSKDFVRQLVQALERHKGNAEQHDDITVTTFRIMS